MHYTRRLIQLAVLGIAAVALWAPPAIAQSEPLLHHKAERLVVQQEVHAAADTPCTPVTPVPAPVPGPLITAGGCRLHLSAPSVVTTLHLSAGVEGITSTCAWEFNVRIDGNAEGYMSHQELTGPPATCLRRPCGQAMPPTSEGRAWSMFMRESEPEPIEEVWFLFCLENRSDGANPMHCEVRLPVSQPTLHRYRFTAVDVPGHGLGFPRCELDGTFDVEAVLETTGEGAPEQSVEIRHT